MKTKVQISCAVTAQLICTFVFTYAKFSFLFTGECQICEPGTSCPMSGMNQTLPCPTGHYCLNGTSDDGVPCPIGTYNPHESIASVDDCLSCLPGTYCDVTGLSAPNGNCSAGYLCLGNATSPTPDDGVNGPCPIASYCLEGRVMWSLVRSIS